MTRRTQDGPLGPLTPADLPAGVYRVSYRGCEWRSWFGQPKVRLEYVIVEPVAYAGIFVSLYATCKADRNKRSSRQSKYYQLWVRVHGSPPQRGQRMTPSIFQGYWYVEVAWSYDVDTPPTTPYVKELLERVAGGGAI